MDNSWFGESLRWYLALVAITWGFAPFTRWLFSSLPDRGASVGRPLALLAVLWPTWFLAGISPIPFTTAGIWLTLSISSGICWFVAYQKSWMITRDWIRTLLIVEGISLAAFASYLALRGYTPQLAFTEKPMDIAFLTSGARTTEIPPSDPWFAGEPINYYYLGYLIHGTLSRISQVPTWTGFNLALGTTASMAFVSAGGATFNIVRRWATLRLSWLGAALAAVFVVIAGNMRAAVEFIRDPSGVFDQSWWPPGTIGWDSSRVVIDHGSSQEQTINEFPWFSLLLGDLHPHLTALPFTLLALSLAVAAIVSEKLDRSRDTWIRLVLAGTVLGALYPLNSLDLPTYFVLFALVLFVLGGWNKVTLLRLFVVTAAAVLAWLPFSARFVPFAGSTDMPDWLNELPILPRLLTAAGWYSGERTSVSEFATVFGLFWVIAVVYLGVRIWQRIQDEGRPVIPRWLIAAGLLILIVAVAIPAPVVVLAGVPLAVALWLVNRARSGYALVKAIPEGLLACAFGLIMATEFFYVQDSFGGRYNTLFKVYYQVWTLFGLAAAAAIVYLIQWSKGKTEIRVVLGIAGVAGLLAALAYPAVATPQWTRVHGPRDWQGLDSAAFLGQFSADDLAAIRWLYDNAEANDVIVEAPGCSYQVYGAVPTGRMAAFTGVPNVIGWDGHEFQWRGGQEALLEELGPRQSDVASIYANPSSELLDKYNATLLFVGSYERFGAGSVCEKAGPYSNVNDPEFPGADWEPVFTSGTSTIYRRAES